jgi:hypothetical protein
LAPAGGSASWALSPEVAQEYLSLILEAIVENYGEYRDYNSMTTQSDRGELLYMLLDFLRLRTQYDRICWQLKPVVWAHELLVRRGQQGRRDLAGRVQRTDARTGRSAARTAGRAPEEIRHADAHRRRPAGGTLHPPDGHRPHPRAGPTRHAGMPQEGRALQQLSAAAAGNRLLTREPSGVGLDVPAWLVALEEEVAETLQQDAQWNQAQQLEVLIPRQPLSLSEARRQLERWRREWKTRA